MARIRTIKPDFWTDEHIVELSAFARLLFIGLWNFADDDGRMEYSPKRIKMQIFPADPIDTTALFGELRREGLIEVYTVDGKEFLQVKNFAKHQKIDKRAASKIPAPQQIPPPPPESPQLPPTEGNGMEGNKKNSKGAFAPPEWVPQDAWQAFLEMRAAKKKPMTTKACQIIVGKLDDFRKSGCDPGAVLLQSVENCWQSVFELKDRSNANSRGHSGQPTKTDRAKAAVIRGLESDIVIEEPGSQEGTGGDVVSMFPGPQALRQGAGNT